MLKDNELIGAITIYRQEVRPFTDKQIELVKNFAAQAVIAIENTRLLNELRESLQQQTATAEVLGVISSSPGELQPVFDAMLANAVRLCAASFGNLYLRDGEFFRLVAFHNTPPAFVAQRRGRPYRPSPIGPPGRMLRTRSVVHVADLTADPSYREHDPGVVAFVELAGTRTVLLVPMLKDGEPIGYLSIYRQEVRPFTDKQIELVTELRRPGRHRHREYAPAQRAAQSALAAADRHRRCPAGHQQFARRTEPVFDTLLATPTRICDAEVRQPVPVSTAMHSALWRCTTRRRLCRSSATARADPCRAHGIGLGRRCAAPSRWSMLRTLMAEQAYLDRHPFAALGGESPASHFARRADAQG